MFTAALIVLYVAALGYLVAAAIRHERARAERIAGLIAQIRELQVKGRSLAYEADALAIRFPSRNDTGARRVRDLSSDFTNTVAFQLFGKKDGGAS